MSEETDVPLYLRPGFWAGAAVVATATFAAEAYRRHRRPPALPDYVPDFSDLPEPPGIEYEDRLPCPVTPEGTVMALEGDDAEWCILPSAIEPAGSGVDFAIGSATPIWPIRSGHPRRLDVSYKDVRDKWHGKWGRHFRAPRGSRYHSGVDLFANDKDLVVAMEDGKIVAILPFYHGNWAIYQLTDSGLLINYGEIANKSWMPFRLQLNQRVTQGQAIARLEPMQEDVMLHFEAYDPGDDVKETIQRIRRGGMQWHKDKGTPKGLLDPTRYLLAAQQETINREARQRNRPVSRRGRGGPWTTPPAMAML